LWHRRCVARPSPAGDVCHRWFSTQPTGGSSRRRAAAASAGRLVRAPRRRSKRIAVLASSWSSKSASSGGRPAEQQSFATVVRNAAEDDLACLETFLTPARQRAFRTRQGAVRTAEKLARVKLNRANFANVAAFSGHGTRRLPSAPRRRSRALVRSRRAKAGGRRRRRTGSTCGRAPGDSRTAPARRSPDRHPSARRRPARIGELSRRARPTRFVNDAGRSVELGPAQLPRCSATHRTQLWRRARSGSIGAAGTAKACERNALTC